MKKLLLLLFGIVSVGIVNAAVCSQTFTVSGNDNAPTILTIGIADIACNLGGTINSLTLNNSAGNLTNPNNGACGGTWYDFTLSVDGSPGITTCGFNGTVITGFTSLTITSADLDAFGDAISITIDVDVDYTPPACSNPAALNVTSVTTTSATLNWTAPPGTPVNYNWEVQPTGVGQGGGTPLASGTALVATSVTTGTVLASGTTYDYFVQTYCGGTDSSLYASGTFTTPLAGASCIDPLVVASLPYSDAGMTTAGFGDNMDDSPCNTNNYMSGDDKVYTYTPAANEIVDVTLTGLGLTYSGLHVTDICADAIGAVCLASSFNAFSTDDLEILNLSLTGGVTYYFTISSWTAPQTATGDFSIALSPTCSNPINQAVSNITATGAELDWDNGLAGAAAQWYVEYGATGFIPGTGAGTSSTVMTFDSLLLTTLSAGTPYDWYVRSYCAPTDTSGWAGPNSFSTINAPPTVPSGVACTTPSANPTVVFSDDFEAGLVGWTGTFGTGPFGTAAVWNTNSGATGSSNTGPNGAFAGTEYIFFEGSTSGTGSAVSPPIDLSGALDDVELSFMMHAYGAQMGTFTVGVGTSVGGPFTNEFTFTGNLQTSSADAWVPVGIDLSAYIGSTIYLELLNVITATWEADMSIDSLVVMACATCTAPSAAATSAITTTKAHLDWDGTGSAIGFWYVEYGLTGFTPGTGTALTPGSDLGVGIGNDTASLAGLTSGTTYDWYVSNICTPGLDTSGLTGPITFTTLADYCAGDHFYDAGGSVGNYSDNVSGETTTVSPDIPTDVVTVTFNSFDTEGGFDFLTIYDGPTTAATVIGVFDGTTIPGPFTSTDPSGALTFEFNSDGSGTRAGWDATFTCGPPPTCFQATDLMVNGITSSTADLSWTPGASGTPHYIIEYDTAGFTQGTGTFAVVVTDTFTTLTGLNAEWQYEWYVKDSCSAGDAGPWSASSNFYTGYCLPVYGTGFNNGCLDGDVIARVQLNTLDNNTGTSCPSGLAGYSDYTDSTGLYTTNLTAGSTYTITITAGPWTEGYAVWIDYNNNLIFETSERVGFTATTIAAGATESFPISLDCNPTPGNYRMRIRAMFATNGGTIDPCILQSNFGEVEDYTVTIDPALSCPQIADLATFGTITPATADFDWHTGCAETAWDYEVNTSPTPPVGVAANSMHTDTFVNASGLTPSTVYYAHVRANCGIGDSSVWSTISFTTPAPAPANDTCGGAISLTVNPDLACGSFASGTLENATASPEANTCGGTFDNDVWYTFTATATEHEVQVSNLAGSSTDMVYQLTDGCGGAQLLCGDFPDSGFSATGLTIGNAYFIRVDTWNGTPANTTFDICVGTPPPPPANDSIGGAIAMACGATETVNTDYATSDAAMGACGAGTGGTPQIGVWYSFVGTGEDIQVSLCGSDFDTKLHIYSGASAGTCVTSNDDGALCGIASRSSITFTSAIGVQYYFLGGGFGTATGNLEISVTCIPVGVVTWTGANSSNYNDAGNWSSPTVPTCSDDVFVPLTANSPLITGAFECGNFGTAASVNPTVSVAGSLGVCGHVSLANGTQISGSGVMRLIGTNTAGAGTFDVAGTANVERLEVGSNYTATGGLDVNSALIMDGGNFDANSATVTLKSNATNTAYFDDWTGTGGTYSGNLTAERFITNGSGEEQHMISSPMSSAPMSEIGDDVSGYGTAGLYGADGIPVTVDDCGTPSLTFSSNYGNVFEYDESIVVGCELDGWVVRSSGNTMNGRGYSAYVNSGSVMEITGTPTSGFVTSGVLSNTPSVVAAQGWHLLGNPYPSPMNSNAITNNVGLTSAQYYVVSGPFTGTYQAYAPSQPVAIAQGFVAQSNGSATYNTTNSDRVASNNPVWYSSETWYTHKLQIDVMGNGFGDRTVLYYGHDNTDNFDARGDCVKKPSAIGQPTISTRLGSQDMSLNGYSMENFGTSIPMGVMPGATGDFVLSFDGLGTFEANTDIYVEDRSNGYFHSVADGDYKFRVSNSDVMSRFIIHYVLPIKLATTNADCQGNLGTISLETPSVTDRNYVLTQGNTTVSSDDLATLNAQVEAGNYVLTVNDAFGGSQVYNVEISDADAIVADMSVSSLSVQVGEVVNFNNLTTNASSVEWMIDGASINGVNNATYSFEEVGTYPVVLSVANADCNATKTVMVEVTNKTTSIIDVDGNQSIKVYSVGTELVLEFINANDSEAVLNVENVIGQRVYNGTVITEGTQRVNIPNVNSGYYFVNLNIAGRNVSTKVLLTK